MYLTMTTLHQPPAPAEHIETSPDESMWLGLNFAWELGYSIAIPAVLFGVGGAYLDKYLGTSPLLLLLGFVLALTTTAISLTKKIRTILNHMPKDMPHKPTEEEVKLHESEAFHEHFRPKN